MPIALAIAACLQLNSMLLEYCCPTRDAPHACSRLTPRIQTPSGGAGVAPAAQKQPAGEEESKLYYRPTREGEPGDDAPRSPFAIEHSRGSVARGSLRRKAAGGQWRAEACGASLPSGGGAAPSRCGVETTIRGEASGGRLRRAPAARALRARSAGSACVHSKSPRPPRRASK